MDSKVKLYIERGENEIDLANVIFKVTEDKQLQKESFNLSKTQTFYSAVISHCYYSIFYLAKAYLLNKGVDIKLQKNIKRLLMSLVSLLILENWILNYLKFINQ